MRRQPPPPIFGRKTERIHCLGAGGMGMAPLAIYLARLGFSVSGEDDAMGGEVAALLSAAGVGIGPRPARCDLLVRSTAIADSHPGLQDARRAGIPAALRGEVLAEVARGRKLVAVCGSHGKTTTTAMLVTALRHAGFPAGFVVGGLFADGAAPAAAGSNDWLVAEVDESDGTIGNFSPEMAVIVNLDWDHPDRYRSPEELEAEFAALLSRTKSHVLVSDACPASLRLAPGAETFGRTGAFRAQAAAGAGGLSLALGGRFLAKTARVAAEGEFNASNAAAALAAAQLMGAEVSEASLARYPGVRRRQAVVLDAGGLTAIEDYAHHPAEIRALLSSLRGRLAPGGRLVAAFQPHRFSRTERFKSEFAASLALADSVHLLDVYPAGEAPLSGGTTADVYSELRRIAPNLPVAYLPGNPAGSVAALLRDSRAGDLVAFVGAGDINLTARAWAVEVGARQELQAKWDRLASELSGSLSAASKVAREEPLAKRTTLRVGGSARVYCEPAGEADLVIVLAAAAGRGVPVLALGRGSNLIIPDSGVDGVVVSLGDKAWSGFEILPDGRVRVGAGLRLKNLCGLAATAGLAGFEFLEGIPGSVGGALRMNAGAMGGWMFDIVDEVRVMSMSGTVRVLARSSMDVAYRHCGELVDAIALGAVLRPMSKAGSEQVGRQIDAYRQKRHESQPREPSAGCIFKNPPGASAGRLIEESGLKGARVGGAEVSRVHANFVINTGGASSADVLELVRRVRAGVREAKGVELEPEVLLYGARWRDVL